jgi:hypothetical protein
MAPKKMEEKRAGRKGGEAEGRKEMEMKAEKKVKGGEKAVHHHHHHHHGVKK